MLLELFGFIAETKENLSEALYENVDTALFDTVIEETFSEIDILATHHSLEEVHIETLEISKIDHKYVYVEVEGSISYELQWGSNSDLKRGDGLVESKGFPFKCQVDCNVRNLKDIKVDISSIEIETREDE